MDAWKKIGLVFVAPPLIYWLVFQDTSVNNATEGITIACLALAGMYLATR